MKNYMHNTYLKLFFLFGLILCSCKQDNQFHQKEKEIKIKYDTTKVTSIDVKNDSSFIKKEISFDIIHSFKEETAESSYTCIDTKLTYKTDNSFMLTKKDFVVTDVDLSETNYEGPGFSIYSYQSTINKSIEIIIIEALADIGTSWYYVIVLNNNDLVDKFYIREPRSNSEKTEIKDFISIFLNNKILMFKFKKDKIAKYSKVAPDLKNDLEYVYIEKILNL
ncbi:hypothetical protein SGQ44_17910 [Flavobacterium sp. Fl-77]|uniref:Lipoprotein n=1 Tax=Flavobacterium flavipigmentatum TaxID=2893884 RepID=A0AAJ2SCI5_9FLAO|nr:MULTISPECIES: hypothetical protein [unclassified Flavobacterium]MDX6184045.1 hypothetical protein [Flavobacterium sp. Fl-33]MDX6187637.1 hypothetical protein [Flavobacterium sp. Fl-77]UFH39221.1 hypothetical protein LNP22_02830 [Flavobacterium sp. F-70]